MLYYTVGLCRVREIHIPGHEARCKTRPYINRFQTPAVGHITDAQGLMRERLPEQTRNVLPSLCLNRDIGGREPSATLLSAGH